MIIESKIESLKEQKVNLKDETVESTNPYLPKMYFCCMWIGAKGTGKTYNLVSLLKHYEKSQILDKKGRVHKFLHQQLQVILIKYIHQVRARAPLRVAVGRLGTTPLLHIGASLRRRRARPRPRTRTSSRRRYGGWW